MCASAVQTVTYEPVTSSALVSAADRQHISMLIDSEYKDLNSVDKALLIKYTEAFRAKDLHKSGFFYIKNLLIRRIAELYRLHDLLPVKSPKRMDITKILVNYNKHARWNKIMLSEIKAASAMSKFGALAGISPKRSITMDDIRKGPIEITIDELPAEIKTILGNTEMKPGYTYMQYIKDNANAIIFTPSMPGTVKIMTENDIGTAEVWTRTVYVDTFDEDTDAQTIAWSLAATLVTGTSHIAWYYSKADQPDKLNYLNDERNATVMKYRFLRALLTSPLKAVELSEKPGILMMLDNVGNKVKRLNKELDYPANYGL